MVDHRFEKFATDEATGCYNVIVGDVVVGYMFHVFETIERRTPGARYVNARYTSQTARWGWALPGTRLWMLYGKTTRKEAVENLLREQG